MEIATPTPLPNLHGPEAIVSPSGRTWKQDDFGRWFLLVGNEWRRLPQPETGYQDSWHAWARFCSTYALTPGANRNYRPTRNG